MLYCGRSRFFWDIENPLIDFSSERRVMPLQFEASDKICDDNEVKATFTKCYLWSHFVEYIKTILIHKGWEPSLNFNNKFPKSYSLSQHQIQDRAGRKSILYIKMNSFHTRCVEYDLEECVECLRIDIIYNCVYKIFKNIR